MSALDFSALSDDQLVELVRAACAEAVRRSPAVESAARGVLLDEADRARIVAQAMRREAERAEYAEAERIAREAAEAGRRAAERDAHREAAAKTRSLWAKQKECATRVLELLGPDADPAEWSMTVWVREGDKRVYLDGPEVSRKAGGRKITYYATGNGRSAPGKLESENMRPVWGDDFADRSKDAKALCKSMAAQWNHLPRTRLSDALDTE